MSKVTSTNLCRCDSGIQAHRGGLLHFLADPSAGVARSYEYFEDGLLLIENGYVKACDAAARLLPQLSPQIPITTHANALIMPGFVDTHVHYPQLEIVASYGKHLLDWLNTYTYPAEKKFSDEMYATQIATQFVDALLRSGTTTALVFSTVHPQSVDAFFHVARQYHVRMTTGKVLMDRLAPKELLETPEKSYHESKQLIERWHGVDRLCYAVTPRFAITSSELQLTMAGNLLREFPDVLMQTHLAETTAERDRVGQLFPLLTYLGVYQKYQLLTERSIFAHAIHLSDDDYQQIAQANAAIVCCPSSNLFLGSGLFPLDKAQKTGVKIAMGTDIGAGNYFSLLSTLNDFYKIAQLRDTTVSPLQAFYWITLGGAMAMHADRFIGNFEVGKEADFVVLDKQATPLLASRMANQTSLMDQLFLWMMLGDDRAIRETYIMGERYQGGLACTPFNTTT